MEQVLPFILTFLMAIALSACGADSRKAGDVPRQEAQAPTVSADGLLK